jgi:hypothetical protein
VVLCLFFFGVAVSFLGLVWASVNFWQLDFIWRVFVGQQLFCAILQFFGNNQKQGQKAKSRAKKVKLKRATI